MNQTSETVLEGTEPTEEDKFYLEWGRETIKNNITLANDTLRQFLTLNVSLLGGSVVLLKTDLISAVFRNVSIGMFFLSLVVCLLGIVPVESNVDIRIPEDVRLHKWNALRWKRRCFGAAAVLLILGLGNVLIGVSLR